MRQASTYFLTRVRAAGAGVILISSACGPDQHGVRDNLARLPDARLQSLGTSAAKVKDKQRELAEVLHKLEKD